MVYITLKSYDINLLNTFCKEILNINKSFDIKGPISLPKNKKLYTTIRSSHIYSLSREQFECSTYSRVFVLANSFNFLKNKKNYVDFLDNYEAFIKKIPVGISLKLKVKF